MQVPDDLSLPNENDALRLPPDATIAAAPAEPVGCLESPPSFFGDARPFRQSADDDEREPEQPERAEPAAADSDRVIDN